MRRIIDNGREIGTMIDSVIFSFDSLIKEWWIMTSFISREAVANCAFIVRHDGGTELRPSVELKTVLEQAAQFAAEFINRRWVVTPILDCNGRMIVLDIDHDEQREAHGRKRSEKRDCKRRDQYRGEATPERLQELSAFYASAEAHGLYVSPFDLWRHSSRAPH
jgi:hypothetical protein